MHYLLAAMTFLVIVGISAMVLYLGKENQQHKIVQRRLDAIEKGMKRGSESLELKLIRDELMSSVPALNRMLLQWSWATKLRQVVAQAGLDIKPGKLVLLSGVLELAGFLVARQFTGNLVLALASAVFGATAPLLFVLVMRARRLHAFEKNFPEAIDLLGRAVQAGHSFSTGLELIGTELSEPLAGEFRAVFDEQNFGLPLKDALLNLAERVPLLDVRFFITALLVQKDTGGNLAEILSNLSHVVRERFKVRGEVRTRTAQGRMTAGILIALPPIMMLVLRFMNPEYEGLLFTDPLGAYMLGLAGGLQVVGAGLLWKIVNIEV
ncbi:MAG TPA: type II secretion system F family protein [Terriglobia bacterium]|jgi:tight adherence protein B|nr:type II secretion system F family protein [Terriglobia bacterium]